MLGWYKGMWKFIYNNFKQILIRLLCTFARTLIDKLTVPFCEDQLQEFLAAGTSAETPIVAEALKAALTDTGMATMFFLFAVVLRLGFSVFSGRSSLCNCMQVTYVYRQKSLRQNQPR